MAKKTQTGKDALLKWCQTTTQGYNGVHVKDFTMSWKDGLAYCALIHKHRPDLIPFDTLDPKDAYKNVDLAFKTAEKLGIPALLDAEDIVEMPKPEPLSNITYLSQIYHYFKGDPVGKGLATIEVPPPLPSKKNDVGPPLPKKTDEEKPKCLKCSKPVSGSVIEVSGGLYHEGCFTCTDCGKQLSDTVKTIRGKPYCGDCGKKSSTKSMTNDKNANVGETESRQAKLEREREEAGRIDKDRRKSVSEVQPTQTPVQLEWQKALSRRNSRASLSSESEASVGGPPSIPAKPSTFTQPPDLPPPLPGKSVINASSSSSSSGESSSVNQEQEQHKDEEEVATTTTTGESTKRSKSSTRIVTNVLNKAKKLTGRDRSLSTGSQAMPVTSTTPSTDPNNGVEPENETEHEEGSSNKKKTQVVIGRSKSVQQKISSMATATTNKVRETFKKRETPESDAATDETGQVLVVGEDSSSVPKLMNLFVWEESVAHLEGLLCVKPTIFGLFSFLSDYAYWPERYFTVKNDMILSYSFQPSETPSPLSTTSPTPSTSSSAPSTPRGDMNNIVEVVPLKNVISVENTPLSVTLGRANCFDIKYVLEDSNPNSSSGSDSNPLLVPSSPQSSSLHSLPVEEIVPIHLTLTLEAASDSERQRWICGLYRAINMSHRSGVCDENGEIVEAVVARPSSQPEPPPVKEGPLSQMILESAEGSFRNLFSLTSLSWKTSWYKLCSGFLLCFASKDTTHPTLKVPLYGCELQEFQPEKFNFSAMEVKTSTHTIVLRAKDQDDLLSWMNAILHQKFYVEEVVNSIEW